MRKKSYIYRKKCQFDVLSAEQMHFLSYSFQSTDTDDKRICQKNKYLFVCGNYTKVQLHSLIQTAFLL